MLRKLQECLELFQRQAGGDRAQGRGTDQDRDEHRVKALWLELQVEGPLLHLQNLYLYGKIGKVTWLGAQQVRESPLVKPFSIPIATKFIKIHAV